MPNLNPKHQRSTIRRSTAADIAVIHAWLVNQKAKGVPGTFLCNWKQTEACHRKKELLVYVDGESGVAVAYQWGGLLEPGILEVRYDMRGKGIGTRLVERRIVEAYKRDENFLYIQCKPVSSISFWKRMGFTLMKNNHAFRILEKKHQLPTDAVPVSVVVQFYPECRKWEDNATPLSTITPSAALTPDNVFHLGERVFFFETLHPGAKDPVVEIMVEGQLLYRDKAKYPESQRLGVQRCRHGFFMDNVLP